MLQIVCHPALLLFDLTLLYSLHDDGNDFLTLQIAFDVSTIHFHLWEASYFRNNLQARDDVV